MALEKSAQAKASNIMFWDNAREFGVDFGYSIDIALSIVSEAWILGVCG